MPTPRVIIRTVLSALIAATVSGQKVHVTTMGSADFGSFETFSFRPFLALATEEPWGNSPVERLLKDAIASELGEKGLRQVDDSPDVFIAVYLGLDQRSWAEDIGQWSPQRATYRGAGISMNEALSRPNTYYRRKGIGVIDLVDARADTVIWRAYCSGNIGDNEDRQKKIYKAVTKAFRKYPPD